MTAPLPWRFFSTTVREVRRLSPSFLRVTFTGDDLDQFADNGFDQRIKLIPPLPDCGHDHLPTGPDWYEEWRDLPDDRRNPILRQGRRKRASRAYWTAAGSQRKMGWWDRSSWSVP